MTFKENLYISETELLQLELKQGHVTKQLPSIVQSKKNRDKLKICVVNARDQRHKMHKTTAYNEIKTKWDILSRFLEWLQHPGGTYAIYRKTGSEVNRLNKPCRQLLAEYLNIDFQMLEAGEMTGDDDYNQRIRQNYHDILCHLNSIHQPNEHCNIAIYKALQFIEQSKTAGNILAFPVFSGAKSIPDYTGSFKIARSLLKMLLPNWHWNVFSNGYGGWGATIWISNRVITSFNRPTREIALLTAIFTLLEKQEIA